MASLMSRKGMKDEIEVKLNSAFTTLVKETYAKNGQFMLSKSATDSIGITFAAVKAIKVYNEHASESNLIKGLKYSAIRDYFLNKVTLSSCTCKAALIINGLSLIMHKNAYPLIKLVSSNTLKLGESGSITAQFVDALGLPISVEGSKLKAANLLYKVGGEPLDVLESSVLDATSGKLTVKINESTKLTKGSFVIEAGLTGWKGATKIRSSESVQVTTTLKM